MQIYSGSKRGAFSSGQVTVIADKKATKSKILAAIADIFGNAKAEDTLFVYLAGHGHVDGDSYFFVPYDADPNQLEKTGVPLSTIKASFEATMSKQVCLWLDFCHSGGILARNIGGEDDWTVMKRALDVVRGHGKIIYAACRPRSVGIRKPHCWSRAINHALLQGLKGKAALDGEVTVSSLYDFIDRKVGNHRQRPEFFGHLQGRMVLIHSPTRGISSTNKKPKRSRQNPSITWVLLDKYFLPAQFVRHNADNTSPYR